MRLFTASILLSISLSVSAQSINEQIANGSHTQGLDIASMYQRAESLRQQQLQNEQARYQLQQQRQFSERNAEKDRLERELLELQIQQEKLKLENLQKGENQKGYNPSMDQRIALTREQVAGNSKTCYYSHDASLYDLSVSSADKCPQSIKVRK